MSHYTVQSSHRAADFRVLVIAVNETRDGWECWVRIDDDPVRLLGKSSGYTHAAAGAMSAYKPVDSTPMGGPQFRTEYEPEAVSEADQRALIERTSIERRARIAADLAGIDAAIKAAEANPDLYEHDLRFLRNLALKLRARKREITPVNEIKEDSAA